MTDSTQGEATDLKVAYRIIVTLMDTLTASSDLIALMAELMGEEAARPLQTSDVWKRYLEAKRRLEAVHEDMHRFAAAATAQIEAERAPGSQQEE